MLTPSVRGEEEDGVVGPGLQPGGVRGVHPGGAGPEQALRSLRPVHSGLERDRLLGPMHEVGAGGVPPVDIVIRSERMRVALEEQMVDASVVHRSVDVVHPPVGRTEVELTSERLGVVRGGIRELRV